ncbi:MAG TPA: hypothetical protein VF538_04105 [Pyrinomonadaceae bacterium]
MNWTKLGMVYVARGERDWAQTHARVPTSIMLDEDRVRVFAGFLDAGKVGRVGFVDVDARDPLRVLRVSERPVLDIGQPGAFDDNGVQPSCVVRDGDRLWLYYTGWQLGVKVRYYMFDGLAASDDGGESFTRQRRVPVLDRSDEELFVRTIPHVLRDGARWRMWYIAGDRWIEAGGKQLPTYNMRYMESGDLARWGERGEVCMDTEGEDEFGFGRPFVVVGGGLHRMWYSIRTRSKGYRLGYAESRDGLAWARRDAEVGIDVSADGWDSQMLCFACVQPTKYGTYLFYNGNNYGETGFGVAVLGADDARKISTDGE